MNADQTPYDEERGGVSTRPDLVQLTAISSSESRIHDTAKLQSADLMGASVTVDRCENEDGGTNDRDPLLQRIAMQPDAAEAILKMSTAELEFLREFARVNVTQRVLSTWRATLDRLRTDRVKQLLLLLSLVDFITDILQVAQAQTSRRCQDGLKNDGPLDVLLPIGYASACVGLVCGVIGSIFDNRILIFIKVVFEDIFQAYVSLQITSRYGGAYWAYVSISWTFATISIEMVYHWWKYRKQPTNIARMSAHLLNIVFAIFILLAIGGMVVIFSVTKRPAYADRPFISSTGASIPSSPYSLPMFEMAMRLIPQLGTLNIMPEEYRIPDDNDIRSAIAGFLSHNGRVLMFNGTGNVYTDAGFSSLPPGITLAANQTRCIISLTRPVDCFRLTREAVCPRAIDCPVCPVSYPSPVCYTCWNSEIVILNHERDVRMCIADFLVYDSCPKGTLGVGPDICYGPSCSI